MRGIGAIKYVRWMMAMMLLAGSVMLPVHADEPGQENDVIEENVIENEAVSELQETEQDQLPEGENGNTSEDVSAETASAGENAAFAQGNVLDSQEKASSDTGKQSDASDRYYVKRTLTAEEKENTDILEEYSVQTIASFLTNDLFTQMSKEKIVNLFYNSKPQDTQTGSGVSIPSTYAQSYRISVPEAGDATVRYCALGSRKVHITKEGNVLPGKMIYWGNGRLTSIRPSATSAPEMILYEQGESVVLAYWYGGCKVFKFNIIDYSKNQSNLPFTDVTSNDPFYEEIADVYSRHLMSGATETTFAPDAALTRSSMAAVLYRMSGSPEVTYQDVFSDVQSNDWFMSCALWTNKSGIIMGYGDGRFAPADKVTREQMCVMIWRYAAYLDGTDTSDRADLTSYPDHKDVTDFAADAVQWCVACGIYPDREGRLKAWEPATRAECAAILSRYIHLRDRVSEPQEEIIKPNATERNE